MREKREKNVDRSQTAFGHCDHTHAQDREERERESGIMSCNWLRVLRGRIGRERERERMALHCAQIRVRVYLLLIHGERREREREERKLPNEKDSTSEGKWEKRRVEEDRSFSAKNAFADRLLLS